VSNILKHLLTFILGNDPQ